MKKLFSIGASLMLAVSVFATGSVGVNPPQSGVLTVTNGVNNITNTFAYPFQSTPLLVVYSSATNGTPITNNFVTTTNFSISFPALGTNDAYAWQVFVGGTKLEYGSVITGGATNVSVTFPAAYAVAPAVFVTSSSTNASLAAVVAVTTTNFTLISNLNSTNSWMSIGQVYNPQTEYQGQFPVNNKVLTP